MKLNGDRSWPFSVIFRGEFRVENVVATWFGGQNDPQDSGETASGYPTRGHPDLLGASLPMDFGDKEPHTKGSPIPRLPWGVDAKGNLNPDGTFVEVWELDHPETPLLVPLIDLGPGKQSTKNPLNPHAIDLTRAAFKKLGGDIAKGTMRVSYRIVSKDFQTDFVPGGIKQSTVNQINYKLDQIMASQAEEAALLAGIKTEFASLLAEISTQIATLTAAVAAAGATSPEVDAATADLKSSIEAALAQFAPPPTP